MRAQLGRQKPSGRLNEAGDRCPYLINQTDRWCARTFVLLPIQRIFHGGPRAYGPSFGGSRKLPGER